MNHKLIQLEAIHTAYDDYVDALNKRQHGGIAMNDFVQRVAKILNQAPSEIENPSPTT